MTVAVGYLAGKAGLFSFSIRKLLEDYLGDVQVVTEFERHRNEILSTTAADFHGFSDVMEEMAGRGRVVVLGSGRAIGAANLERSDFLTVSKVA